MLRRVLFVVIAGAAVAGSALAQQNHIDAVAPVAPELASYGRYDIGVRTLQVTDRNRPDILNTKEGGTTARYDRTLTLEVWHPAKLTAGQKPGGEYRVITRDPAIAATLYGKAVRDAPVATDGPFPLVIISHGYPGNRYLMSHLGENLASKGFVVASIDHKDSTYDDQKSFASTLYNRPFDQLVVLNELARMGKAGSGSFLSGLVDDSRVGLVGYSMGGYGVVNVVGGGYSTASETLALSPPNRLLAERGAANPDYKKSTDPRIKAAIAIAPWGMPAGFWDAEGLKGITTPVLFVAGSVDDVAGYEKGARAIYQQAVNADRYLLTYVNANHNAGAPIPAPAETYAYSEALKSFPFVHYADAVWDTTRMNNILDHFATAYFGVYLKGEQDKKAYLDPPPDAPWKGFKPRTAVGLTLEHAQPAAASAALAAVQAPEIATTVAFTEGPAVDRDGNVYFTDIINQRIMKLGADGALSTYREKSNVANGLLIDPQGRLIACEGGPFERPGVKLKGTPRVTRTDLKTGKVEVLAASYEGKPFEGPNDVTIDGKGRLYFTDLAGAAVYRIDASGTVARILAGPNVQRPNGIQVSPDDTTLYLIEANQAQGGARLIRAYDLQPDGTVRNMRVHYNFSPGRSADGMSIDTQGNLYASAGMNQLRGSSETLDTKTGVYVISPQGKLLKFIPIPEDFITNNAFGGADMKTLYVTAGKTLYKVRTDIAGLPR